MIKTYKPLDDAPYEDFFERYNFNNDLMMDFEEK